MRELNKLQNIAIILWFFSGGALLSGLVLNGLLASLIVVVPATIAGLHLWLMDAYDGQLENKSHPSMNRTERES